MRILVGHQDYELSAYDTRRYDVRVVRYRKDGQGPPATIAEMLEQCPPGWKPDVYYHASLVHFPIPTDIKEFEGLTATNIQDWHRGGRAVWAGAGFFDLITTERNACALLEASGYANAKFARFWGANPQLHRILPEVEKDIDVLFIGSLNAAVWGERNRWVDRLARLSDKYRVVVAMGHYGEDYVRLTNRAKIVFNRSVNGCTNQRAYDGSACGALVFNEEEGEETREIFEDRVHCVYYNADNFEALLEYYLTHEEERRRIVEAARERILAQHTEEAHANSLFALIEANLDKAGYRPSARLPRAERHVRKALQMFSCALPASASSALALLEEAEREGYDRARLEEARAALCGWVAHYLPAGQKIPMFTEALRHARQAVQAAPDNAVAQMTLAFLLLERAEAAQGKPPVGRNDIAEAALALVAAAERCEKSLAQEGGTASFTAIEGFGYPRWSDSFDSYIEGVYLARGVDTEEWARGKRAGIAWRCRSMLSDLALANDQREEAYRQALAAAQDLPQNGEALLRLARCTAMTGRLEEAVLCYREGLAVMPLAYEAWPELATVLVALGRRAEAEAFVQERLRVVRAIPSFAAIRPALTAALA
ncbi:MAG TPA: glycosyltransferase [Chthonomonadaceae bacterium]|nr:glycosyltransferase [Chthonomonadaceae bacterium]